MPSGNPELIAFLRDEIQKRGPQTFRWFMEQALYHPAHGYYSSGRCVLGRAGDYFTNVSVGSLFGKLLATQFVEIWEKLGRPDEFTIVEQGAHDGDFAADVLEAVQNRAPEFFCAVRYEIIEAFSVLRERQRVRLAAFQSKIAYRNSLADLPAFCGVHFSNELLDAMPVHLVVASDGEWQEKFVTLCDDEIVWCERALSDEKLRKHLASFTLPNENRFETEVNLEALHWIETLSARLDRGYILTVDYGRPREELSGVEKAHGSLRCVAQHRALASPFEEIGRADMTAHVDWTSLAERGEEHGLRLEGFTDQHHFLAGLLKNWPNELSFINHTDTRALQTLLHPEMLGRTFQMLAFSKGVDEQQPLAGFSFARDPRTALGLNPER